MTRGDPRRPKEAHGGPRRDAGQTETGEESRRLAETPGSTRKARETHEDPESPRHTDGAPRRPQNAHAEQKNHTKTHRSPQKTTARTHAQTRIPARTQTHADTNRDTPRVEAKRRVMQSAGHTQWATNRASACTCVVCGVRPRDAHANRCAHVARSSRASLHHDARCHVRLCA